MNNNGENFPKVKGIEEILDEANPDFNKDRPKSKISEDKKAAIEDYLRRPLGEEQRTREQKSNEELLPSEDKKSKLRVINGGKPEKLKTLPDNRI